MSAATQRLAPMTVTEFLAWDPPGGDRWELVDGEPRAMAPASPRHGAIFAEVARLIGTHLADLRPACRIIAEPGIQPRAHGIDNVRVPDLAVTCAAWDAEAKLLPEPLVVIEVRSPSNVAKTRANVWSYTTIPSVAEILVLHATAVRGELLCRDEHGEWPGDPDLLGPGDAVRLDSIGFAAPLTAFYRTAE